MLALQTDVLVTGGGMAAAIAQRQAISFGLGVRILDHSPALELRLHADGSVAGAQGYRRQVGEDWTICIAPPMHCFLVHTNSYNNDTFSG